MMGLLLVCCRATNISSPMATSASLMISRVNGSGPRGISHLRGRTAGIEVAAHDVAAVGACRDRIDPRAHRKRIGAPGVETAARGHPGGTGGLPARDDPARFEPFLRL